MHPKRRKRNGFQGHQPELREKAKKCTSPEEVLELAKREGYKLSEGELEAISGGGWSAASSYGDTREGIDPGLAHEDFANGIIDGGELD